MFERPETFQVTSHMWHVSVKLFVLISLESTDPTALHSHLITFMEFICVLLRRSHMYVCECAKSLCVNVCTSLPDGIYVMRQQHFATIKCEASCYVRQFKWKSQHTQPSCMRWSKRHLYYTHSFQVLSKASNTNLSTWSSMSANGELFSLHCRFLDAQSLGGCELVWQTVLHLLCGKAADLL